MRDEDLGYFLGVMKGDGSSYVTHDGLGYSRYCIQLEVTDREFAERFQAFLRNYGIQRKIVLKKAKNARQRFTYFIHYYKSKPYELWEISRWDLEKIESSLTDSGVIGFLRGIYESEGGFYSNEKGGDFLNACTTSDEGLAVLVLKFLNRLGFKGRILSAKQSPRAFSKGVMYYVRVLGGAKEFARFFKLINPCIKRPEIVNCKLCGAEIVGATYCSKRCARRKGRFVKCFFCGKEIWRPEYRLRLYKTYFCSHSCHIKWLREGK